MPRQLYGRVPLDVGRDYLERPAASGSAVTLVHHQAMGHGLAAAAAVGPPGHGLAAPVPGTPLCALAWRLALAPILSDIVNSYA